MSFGSAPTPPDPNTVASTQTNYNTAAAKTQNQVNSYDQSGPLGNVSYVADSNSPSGYSIQTSAGATGQPLINSATNLANASAGMYSSPYDLNAASQNTAKTLNSWQQAYNAPIFGQQQSNLDAQLRNQGLSPGSEAWNNAQNLLARNQGDVTNQYLTQNQGQAFNQALTAYQTPLQTISGLLQTGAPQGFQGTPNAQVQPANYAGAAQNAYQGQLQNYENNQNNYAKLGTAAIGLAAAPFTGGLSLAALGGLAGGVGNSSPGYGNFGQYSPYSPANA